jgi:hypothetical protein
MSETTSETRVSYPYMSAAQWSAVRTKLRQSVPKAIDVDWLMAALGVSNKGAQNTLPQLRAIGLIDDSGSPSDVALDIRDDETYATATATILNDLYPQSLRDAYNDPEAEPSDVARWFMRNARTGEATAKMQARLYLMLLSGKPPETTESRANGTSKRRAPSPTKPDTQALKPPATKTDKGSADSAGVPSLSQLAGGPSLHIDLQIHIGADASDSQIEAVFKSMAKHLYGKD